MGKAVRLGNRLGLFSNRFQEVDIPQIGPISLRFLPADSEVELQGDWEATDLQIIELRAQESHGREVAIIERMLRRYLRHHTIRGNDFEDVQTFHDRGRERHPSVMLRALTSRHSGETS